MELAVHEGEIDGWVILQPEVPEFLIGNSPDDVSWDCPCGTRLANGLYARQILNMLVRCCACERYLATPIRRPGEPLAGKPIYFDGEGAYRFNHVDLTDRQIMMVGREALYGYARETGKFVAGVYEPPRPSIVTAMDEGNLRTVGEGLRSLLGKDWMRLSDSDRRGRRSKTPPAKRHRLIELAEFADKTAEALAADEGPDDVAIDRDMLAESVMVLAAARRWQHHPAWEALQSTLASDSEAAHTCMLLTVASYLVDLNIGIGIYTGQTSQGQTTADIWLQPNLRDRVDLEVKTPMALRSPQRQISEPHSIAIIERLIKKSSRQRRNVESSLLVIGGFHMGDAFQTLLSTAKAILALERRRWRGLAGIAVADCSYELKPRGRSAQRDYQPHLRVGLALHPGYRGPLIFDTSPQALVNAPDGMPRTLPV